MTIAKHIVHNVTEKERDTGREFGILLCSILQSNSVFEELNLSAIILSEFLGLQIRVERPVNNGIDYCVTHVLYEELEAAGLDQTMKAMHVAAGLMASLLLQEDTSRVL